MVKRKRQPTRKLNRDEDDREADVSGFFSMKKIHVSFEAGEKLTLGSCWNAALLRARVKDLNSLTSSTKSEGIYIYNFLQ
jgi:hypothetical protein